MHTPKYGVETQTKFGLPNLAGRGVEAEVAAIPTAERTHTAAMARNTKYLRMVGYLPKGLSEARGGGFPRRRRPPEGRLPR